jgi:hypothetical protein
MTIKELEALIEKQFSHSLSTLPPQFHLSDYRLQVQLTNQNGRRTRSNASAEKYWSPESDEIRISFEPATPEPARRIESKAPEVEVERVPPAPALPTDLCELLRQLDNAEKRPGYDFVALKWFRDAVLPAVRPEWSDPDARNNALRAAIDRGLVRTNKVPNPKSPAFPVTAVRLNRSADEVCGVLGASGGEAGPRFRPLPIRGEPLSSSILRERR